MSVPLTLMLPVGRLDQPQDRAADRGLAAAGLADQRERLAGADRQRHAVDRVDIAGGAAQQALLDREVLLEVLDLEHSGRGSGMAGSVQPRRSASTPPSAPGASPRRPALPGGSGRSANGQRGANAQPGGRLVSAGTMPGISCSRRFVSPASAAHQFEPRDRGHQPVRVGMQRAREQFADRRFLHLLARIHHDHALRGLGHDAEIVRDENDARCRASSAGRG